MQKGFSGDPTTLPARETLLMATRMGANALHIGHITGSLEPGKRADLILLDINKLHNSPHFEHDSQGTYSSAPRADLAMSLRFFPKRSSGAGV